MKPCRRAIELSCIKCVHESRGIVEILKLSKWDKFDQTKEFTQRHLKPMNRGHINKKGFRKKIMRCHICCSQEEHRRFKGYLNPYGIVTEYSRQCVMTLGTGIYHQRSSFQSSGSVLMRQLLIAVQTSSLEIDGIK